MPRELLIQGPDGAARTVPLTGRLTVGRSNAAELCFPEDAGLSRQHFAFESDGDGGWTIQDLGSKNGTFVRVSGESPLFHGDYVFVGQQLLRVEIT